MTRRTTFLRITFSIFILLMLFLSPGISSARSNHKQRDTAKAGGNDPKARQKVLDIVVELIDGGYLEPRGSDFYDITIKGQAVLGDYEI